MRRALTTVTTPSRENILDLQAAMLQAPGQVEFPVKHHFSDGIYAREAFLQAGIRVIGKIHKHGHLNIISSGSVKVWSEFGVEEIKAPHTFRSEPGIKRVIVAYEDTVWTTIHLNPSNTQDLSKLEEEIIAPSYDNLLEEHA